MVFAPLGGSHGICERGRSDRAKRAWIRHPTRRGDRHALTFASRITHILPRDFEFPQLASAAPGKMCVIDCCASTPDVVIVHFAARFRVSAVGVRGPGQNVRYRLLRVDARRRYRTFCRAASRFRSWRPRPRAKCVLSKFFHPPRRPRQTGTRKTTPSPARSDARHVSPRTQNGAAARRPRPRKSTYEAEKPYSTGCSPEPGPWTRDQVLDWRPWRSMNPREAVWSKVSPSS